MFSHRTIELGDPNITEQDRQILLEKDKEEDVPEIFIEKTLTKEEAYQELPMQG